MEAAWSAGDTVELTPLPAGMSRHAGDPLLTETARVINPPAAGCLIGYWDHGHFLTTLSAVAPGLTLLLQPDPSATAAGDPMEVVETSPGWRKNFSVRGCLHVGTLGAFALCLSPVVWKTLARTVLVLDIVDLDQMQASALLEALRLRVELAGVVAVVLTVPLNAPPRPLYQSWERVFRSSLDAFSIPAAVVAPAGRSCRHRPFTIGRPVEVVAANGEVWLAQ